MSSIVNKVKEALHSDKDKDNTHSHNTAAGSRLNEPRVDAEHDARSSALNSGAAGNTGYTSNTNYATGPTSSGPGPAPNTSGPHSSDLANKLDPRVDSDIDNSRTGYNTRSAAAAHNTHGTAAHTGTAGTAGTIGTTGAFTSGPGPASNTAGPHASNLANKADPRVDSDLDGRSGFNNTHSSTAHTGTTGTTGAPITSHAIHGQQYNTPGVNTTGPSNTTGMTGTTGATHSGLHTTGASGINTTTGTTGAGYGTGNNITGTTHAHNTHGVTGTHGTTGSNFDNTNTIGATGTHTTTGPHGTTAGNFGSTTAGDLGAHTNPGPAPNTAGPHSSDTLNKLDPRVDSNLDGSKTVGGNQTAQATRRDPTDAAQVPPSVMQKHIGAPTVHHEDANHDRERRHSVSHRETHSGL